MPAKKKHYGKTVQVSCRMSERDFLPFAARAQQANMSVSDFFRDCIIRNKTEVLARPLASPNYRKMLFFTSKGSNNLNQLAHRANADAAAGVLSEKTYSEILVHLEMLARFMKAGL